MKPLQHDRQFLFIIWDLISNQINGQINTDIQDSVWLQFQFSSSFGDLKENIKAQLRG
jgi:hypothetical protein